jgi:hypothetical protein
VQQQIRRALAILLASTLLAAWAHAHETSDMRGPELVAASWMNALIHRDTAALAAMLDTDATAEVDLANQVRFTNADAFVAYLAEILREFPVQDTQGNLAYFTPQNGGVRVGPLVTAQAGGANLQVAWFLDVSNTTRGWKIRHVDVNIRDVPESLSKGWRPELELTRPVKFRLLSSEGRPIDGRVSIRDSSGNYWPPQGHPYAVPTGWREDVGGDIKVGDRVYAYVPSEFIAELPLGKFVVDASHGLEFTAREQPFEKTSDDSREVVVRLDRWVDMNAAGWYSGDTHVHFVRPRTAALEGRGEGVNVVNILAAKWGNLITNVDDFTGRPDPATTTGNFVYVGEEARHGFLGHTALIGLKHLVFPLSWGSGPLTGVPGGSDYPPMAHLADEARRQGGLVSWAHFPGPRGEVAVDIALGKVDSVDLLTWGDPMQAKGDEPSRVQAWYGFLNCGFRLPVTAGTDKMFNTQIIGTPRVYVQLDAPLSYERWLDGIRRGRTFVTTGPLLTLNVDGNGIGAALERARGSVVTVSATARSQLPILRLEILRNGLVVDTASARSGSDELALTTRVTIDSSSWIAARVVSDAHLPYQTVFLDRAEPIPVFAHTSPIYVSVPGAPQHSSDDATRFVRWVDEGTEWITKRATFQAEAERQEMLELFERARRVYLQQVQED